MRTSMIYKTYPHRDAMVVYFINCILRKNIIVLHKFCLAVLFLHKTQESRSLDQICSVYLGFETFLQDQGHLIVTKMSQTERFEQNQQSEIARRLRKCKSQTKTARLKPILATLNHSKRDILSEFIKSALMNITDKYQN